MKCESQNSMDSVMSVIVLGLRAMVVSVANEAENLVIFKQGGDLLGYCLKISLTLLRFKRCSGCQAYERSLRVIDRSRFGWTIKVHVVRMWETPPFPKDVIRKIVYVCPEKSCVHNHPSRALGDLPSIKKHFCR
ncbi:protein indeterminate-domain 11-like isoform X3 [Senna tora]|uniref:Protein indeterminate-domain 11-like isoform X3 n=1 Tax=Senna tora TaxID=362788 RepID=A0A834T322_9FABA|nr:protein indeterminate-domain 11-like isoform X3 [Senna tora]